MIVDGPARRAPGAAYDVCYSPLFQLHPGTPAGNLTYAHTVTIDESIMSVANTWRCDRLDFSQTETKVLCSSTENE